MTCVFYQQTPKHIWSKWPNVKIDTWSILTVCNNNPVSTLTRKISEFDFHLKLEVSYYSYLAYSDLLKHRASAPYEVPPDPVT